MSQNPPPLSYYTPQPPQPPPEREGLTGVDWVIIILCAGIGCIVGILRVIQGKPSGPKMIGYSILSMIFWAFIKLLIMALTDRI